MRKPNTFILFWNPLISNVQGDSRPQFVADLLRGCQYEACWSIWDWRKVKDGDRFFRVRCGMPHPEDDGIIDSGYLKGRPFLGLDWAHYERKVHYAYLHFDVVVDYNSCPVLLSDKLDLRIPRFDWHGGHNGRLLEVQDAQVLESLWLQHIDSLQSNPETTHHLFTEKFIIE